MLGGEFVLFEVLLIDHIYLLLKVVFLILQVGHLEIVVVGHLEPRVVQHLLGGCAVLRVPLEDQHEEIS